MLSIVDDDHELLTAVVVVLQFEKLSLRCSYPHTHAGQRAGLNATGDMHPALKPDLIQSEPTYRLSVLPLCRLLQIETAAAFVSSTEAKLQVHGEYIRELEASLAAEQQRVGQLLGSDLGGLGISTLQQLARIHEDGLRRVRTLLVCDDGYPCRRHSK